MRVAAFGCLMLEASYVLVGDPESVHWLIIYNSTRYLLFAIIFFECGMKRDIKYINYVFQGLCVFFLLHIAREVNMWRLSINEYASFSRSNSEIVSATYLSVTLVLVVAGYYVIYPTLKLLLKNIKQLHK